MTDTAALREAMVDSQVRPSDIVDYPVIAAMLEVPREAFVPERYRPVAYADMQIPLAPGRTILEPRTLARMLDSLDLGPDDLVLDIGAGLGYAPALMSRIVQAVIGVEELEGLADEANVALATHAADNAMVIAGPLAQGAPKYAPYDAILIEGGIEELPQAIFDQLREGGRIAAIRLEGRVGHAALGVKHAGIVAWRHVDDFTAPLLPGFARAREFAL